MGRLVVVLLLVCSLFVCGCAHHQPVEKTEACAEGSDQEELASTVRRYSWRENWIENYPVLNGLTNATYLILLITALAVALGAYGLAEAHSGH
jgi:hypothetical protein